MKTTRIVFYCLCGLAAAGALFFIFTLLYLSTLASSGSLQEKLNDLNRKETELSALRQQSREWQGISKEYQEFRNTYLVSGQNYPELRQELNAIFQLDGLTPGGITYTTVQISPDITQARIHFSLSDDYSKIKKFVSDIRKIGRAHV